MASPSRGRHRGQRRTVGDIRESSEEVVELGIRIPGPKQLLF